MKAQAAALIPDSFRMWEPRGESSKRKDDETGPLFTNTPIELRSRGTEVREVHLNVEDLCQFIPMLPDG